MESKLLAFRPTRSHIGREGMGGGGQEGHVFSCGIVGAGGKGARGTCFLMWYSGGGGGGGARGT